MFATCVRRSKTAVVLVAGCLSMSSHALAQPVAPSEASPAMADERDNLIVTPYVGIAIDSFAAGDINAYLNQDESGEIKERATAGFEFSYRLIGNPADSTFRNGRQFWIYGRTTHGVRSADVDCRESPQISVCEPFALELQNPTERGLYLLRNASSLEGHAGLRWEFAEIQPTRTHAARAYLNAQLGFVAVTDGPDDVADIHHVSLGAMISNGLYERSFFEVGYGRNDLILENRTGRFKLNARVVRKWTKSSAGSVFAHIAVDVDAGSGSDSIQTYLGVAFALPGTPDDQ